MTGRLVPHAGPGGVNPPRAPTAPAGPHRARRGVAGVIAMLWLGTAVAALAAGCAGDEPVRTPPITPGTAVAPREVNLILKDYLFIPKVLDLVPGETVLLHVVNGGLITHEVVVGGPEVQQAWSAAEAAVANPPPGPTPLVSVPPELSGLRVVVDSGGRQDVTWTVPTQGPLLTGCHIPGHFEKGMAGVVRFVAPGGAPLDSTLPASPRSAAP